MSQKNLKHEIIGLSIANYWHCACEEWSLHSIYDSEEPQICLCGHRPIREVCILKNKYNGNGAEVGNCCVKRILNTSSKKLFSSLSRVIEDIEASFNSGVIELAHDRSLIDSSERDGYLSIWRKRKLSPEQIQQKLEINERLLAHYVR